ncbi:type II toxin-antitoxin system PemK/MazF family toxin [Xylanimonas allomyrinae]|uniref:Type II toxin-antitoxin system PemK/MazF family toxin n=1 Tax=Xylanimonas allomyrinae TaxID=2509459 RepID=A0A4P6ENK8_9MICO|nr:type II toxin-antitoxin system PemK/MazF family toxin [Xylanimonas allomyrinae]QAY64304.1 type II toxin-antitoxin system PemK/MazF family toxin [Xylanimonas allomyrinae]
MRGDIYRLRTRDTEGHGQRGPRYAVVVQSDRLHLSTLLIAPTSTSAMPGDMRPRINMNGTATYVLVEQTRAVNPETRLGDFAGRLDADELAALDDALRIVLGLY